LTGARGARKKEGKGSATLENSPGLKNVMNVRKKEQPIERRETKKGRAP